MSPRPLRKWIEAEGASLLASAEPCTNIYEGLTMQGSEMLRALRALKDKGYEYEVGIEILETIDPVITSPLPAEADWASHASIAASLLASLARMNIAPEARAMEESGCAPEQGRRPDADEYDAVTRDGDCVTHVEAVREHPDPAAERATGDRIKQGQQLTTCHAVTRDERDTVTRDGDCVTRDRSIEAPALATCEAAEDAKREHIRALKANRQRNCRARKRDQRDGVTRDTSQKRNSPTPPKEKTSSLRSESFRAEEKFEEFRSRYPERSGGHKWSKATKLFPTLVQRGVDPDKIVRKAGEYAASTAGIAPEYIEDAYNWLKSGRYEDDFTLPTPAPSARPRVSHSPLSGRQPTIAELVNEHHQQELEDGRIIEGYSDQADAPRAVAT